MTIRVLENYQELSLLAAEIIFHEIKQKPNLLLCPATGNSPYKTYQILSDRAKLNKSVFSQIRLIKLDEWGGLPAEDPGSCETYLQNHLINPLEIPASRYISFPGNDPHTGKICQEVDHALEKEGPIDLCILGIGRNGHLAMNEPAGFLSSGTHKAKLAISTQAHSLLDNSAFKPKFGISLGIGSLLQSSKILLLISGMGKSEIVKKLMDRRITTRLPASLLWAHPNVTLLMDKEAATGLDLDRLHSEIKTE